MSSHPSTFRSRGAPLAVAALGLAAALLAAPSARAQACCAGSGAVTPGRLGLHEVALVGFQAKAGSVAGSYDIGGDYVRSPPGAGELDLEQDIFGSVRVLERGQVALLVPLIETWRNLAGLSASGGGIGDVNASARYDVTLAGASRTIPGVAALAGLTLPTGTPPDSSNAGKLATGATGIGAYQFNLGIAVEQTVGAWLVNATGVVAERTARTVGSGFERRPRAARAAMDAPRGCRVHVRQRLGGGRERVVRVRGKREHRRGRQPRNGSPAPHRKPFGGGAAERFMAASGGRLRQPADWAAGHEPARGHGSLGHNRCFVAVKPFAVAFRAALAPSLSCPERRTAARRSARCAPHCSARGRSRGASRRLPPGSESIRPGWTRPRRSSG